MLTNDPRMNVKKPPLGMKETAAEQPSINGTTRPKNSSANLLPSEGYVLEIDGKLKSEYQTSEAATKAELELKKKYPYIQVIVSWNKRTNADATRMAARFPRLVDRQCRYQQPNDE